MSSGVNKRLVLTDTRRINVSSGVPHEGLWSCRRRCPAQGAGVGSTSVALALLRIITNTRNEVLQKFCDEYKMGLIFED
jgi:hypothetical protein